MFNFIGMNYVKISLLLLMVTPSFLQAQKLSDYTWKHRIIILSDTDAEFENAKPALTSISAYKEKLKDRDIILFLHRNGQFYSTGLKPVGVKTTASIPKNFTGYLLIGKDGGIKAKKSYPIHPEAIFTLIDGMPMRQAELRSEN